MAVLNRGTINKNVTLSHTHTHLEFFCSLPLFKSHPLFIYLDIATAKKNGKFRAKYAPKFADSGDLLKISQIFSAKRIEFHV